MRKNSRLPNLHNFGIHLRILLLVNLFALLAACLLSHDIASFLQQFTALSTLVQPILMISLIYLYLLYPLLDKLAYSIALAIILLMEMGITAGGLWMLSGYFSPEVLPEINRACLFTAVITAIVFYYFNLLQRAYSPAIAEARLQALQARIRPHFLFNSINAVLSLIRTQPRQAETALEDMADLFRVLMADNRDLVPLAQEIALCRQYLSIEKLRLGDRLQIEWQIEQIPPDALIPPLILQPLLENAVYHGIEPLAEGGAICIIITAQRTELTIRIENPFVPEKTHQHGNKMAMKNIRERLLLHYDLEAQLHTEQKLQRFLVQIRIPNKI